MREIDHMAIAAMDNQEILDNLIIMNESFILRCASKVSKRYITKSDDECSIAMIAFTQAVQSYRLDKGSFLKFAEMVIKRRLIDYFRTQVKYTQEIAVSPNVFGTDIEEEDEDLHMKLAISKNIRSSSSKDDTKIEIETINEIINQYGFSFFDLIDCSPKSYKTKKHCAKAVTFLLESILLFQALRNSRQLPIKAIETGTKIPRKVLERHRKYIIAAAEILYGDFPNLKEYMEYIKDEVRTNKTCT